MLRPTFTVPASFDTGTGARSNAPTDLRSLYQQAATTCPGLPWGVLAGIGQVETNHGQNTAVSSAGAMGPMQFIPSTWAIYGVDGDGDGKANILDQVDAVYSAARYLCASGGGNPDTLYEAIFSYNHADWYVRQVLALAAQYR
jgi:membrane-bound lytic murein transglycosylase B